LKHKIINSTQQHLKNKANTPSPFAQLIDKNRHVPRGTLILINRFDFIAMLVGKHKLTDMKTIKFALLILTIITFSSCEKSNINEYQDFVGTWTSTQSSEKHEIIVKTNGKTTYEKTTSNTEVYFRGRLIINDDEMKIGLKKLIINKFPEQSSETYIWQMTLDGIVYSKN
jgi:hypothetical protein